MFTMGPKKLLSLSFSIAEQIFPSSSFLFGRNNLFLALIHSLGEGMTGRHFETTSTKDSQQSKTSREPICVVGIDFGTSRTGYGFAFKNNPGVIVCKEPGGQEAVKTNTALLLNRDGHFLAFGSKALEKYYEIDGHDLLFEKFKMNLHHQDGENGDAKALNGESKPLIYVISKVLEFVKKEAMSEINKTLLTNISMRDILWVITVPAIWSDTAKGAMRRAALNAGIIEEESSPLLELALEPEAACAACESEKMQLKRNDTFMVLDCGGGTVDITMHRVTQKEPVLKLDEICPPTGGPWGSTFADAEFENFIAELVGVGAFQKFKPSLQWLDLMKTWESTKLSFEFSKGSGGELVKSINVSCLLEFVDTGLKELVERYNLIRGTRLGVRGQSILRLPNDIMKSFFAPVIDNIIHRLRELLQAHNFKYIFLVGGFAESKMLQQHIRDSFEKDGRRIVVPMRPGLAVVRGAVMVGLGASEQFTSRITRHTYGVEIHERVQDGRPVDPKDTIVYHTVGGKNVPYITERFSPIVMQGARVALDEVFQGNYQSLGSICQCRLFVSSNPKARKVTEDGLKSIGSIVFQSEEGDSLRVMLSFGQTELKAAVLDKRTKVMTPVQVEYDFSRL